MSIQFFPVSSAKRLYVSETTPITEEEYDHIWEEQPAGVFADYQNDYDTGETEYQKTTHREVSNREAVELSSKGHHIMEMPRELPQKWNVQLNQANAFLILDLLGLSQQAEGKMPAQDMMIRIDQAERRIGFMDSIGHTGDRPPQEPITIGPSNLDQAIGKLQGVFGPELGKNRETDEAQQWQQLFTDMSDPNSEVNRPRIGSDGVRDRLGRLAMLCEFAMQEMQRASATGQPDEIQIAWG